MEWDWSRISINELVSEAIESARPQLRSERVELSETVEPELWINGDAAAIGRMLGHLLSNALRHTGTGDVHVRASAFDRAGARWLRLVVDDSGEGMTKEIARHAGEAFALSSGLLDEEHVHGRGFGLAICKGIAAAHGGTVQIDSTPGSGTAVTVDLQAELAQPVPSESSDQPTGHGDEGPSRVAGRALPIAARG
jgi:signal transduction histidine kinase